MKLTVKAFVFALLIYSVTIPAHAQDRSGARPASAQGRGGTSFPRPTPADPAAFQAATNSLRQIYTPEQLKQGVYVGSNLCLSCHSRMANVKATNHGSFMRRPLTQQTLVPGMGVIANSLKGTKDDFIAGLDFNALTGTPFDKYKPNAPVLSVENGTYYITIGTLKVPVIATLAGQRPSTFSPSGTAQRYLVRIPVTDNPSRLSASAYLAPFSYAPDAGYTAATGGWYDATTNAPKVKPGMTSAAVASAGLMNHTGSCLGCHTSGPGVIAKTAAGEYSFKGFIDTSQAKDDPTLVDYDYDGQFEVMNIGCEACHGPGANHVLSNGAREAIINPRSLPLEQQVDICGRCHANGKSVPSGAFSWPLDEATNATFTPFDAKAGKPLTAFYAFNPNMWPDGTHVAAGRLFNAYKMSAHAKTVGCTTCHNPHAEGEGHLMRGAIRVGNLRIPTKVSDNSFCLSCHAAKGTFASLTAQDIIDGAQDAKAKDRIETTVEAHTHHPYAPEREMGLSRCTTCHLAAGHGFDVIPPAMTLQYASSGRGMINSCAAACHNNKADVWGYGFKGGAGRNPSDSGTNPTTWTNPFDTTLAKKLKTYFGEAGTWWKTGK